ncbi:MAG: PhzF family phenazine biosynthesis protein [Bacteroidia bacterium]|nr:MAG: PhzF family phenazine biosynthesis protein [Bacteroidia bacterium]
MKAISNTIYHVDAFTGIPFRGNPAGVLISDLLPHTGMMQNIAMEMNLSETAFVAPEGENYIIRFYTPEAEIALCGHATLSASHILFELGMASDRITFYSKVGELSVRKEKEMIVMNFPQYSYRRIDIPQLFVDGAGFTPVELYECDHNWKMAILTNEQEVRDASPDFQAIKRAGFGDLIITARSYSSDYDFVVRCFVPEMGINEDPVTGSAHCALTPYWAEKTGKVSFRSMQLSKRTGKLFVSMAGDRVEVAGTAVTFSRAEIMI